MGDEIHRFLPELPRYREPVTVAMLLHHTSGIRDMLELGAYAGYETSASVSREDALKLVFSQTETAFAPGTQHRYSNSGYLLLSEIIARVSGIPFAEFMQNRVFDPLGMRRTRILDGSRVTDVNSAHGYAPSGEGYKLADTHPFYGGSGGEVTTINDLAKYDHDIQVAHKVWTPEVSKIMLAPGTLASGAPAARGKSVYAGGLSLDGAWVHHGGAAEGYRNMVAWLPAGRLSVHVLCNNGSSDAAAITDRVVAAIGGFPPPHLATMDLAGRYASVDLPVIYTLSPVGTARLDITIEPRGNIGRKRLITLTRAPDGSYMSKGFRLVADPDRRGFLLGDDRGRVGSLHFLRAD
jgi:CubicO group peptidase (beta-lactamase class C family)